MVKGRGVALAEVARRVGVSTSAISKSTTSLIFSYKQKNILF
ncbi:hypothetical protein D1BOALGB6SA_4075 [Olavius sp. associated proteobacterium Delta 1]|nr:hypothetical protein D1BOALGB6SA_4075 [Olavius sp. associated proteobacterium Delta 1]